MSSDKASNIPTSHKGREQISNDHLERKVIVQPHGKCNAIDPHEWPSGEFLANLCRSFTDREGLSSTTTSANHYQSESVDQEMMQEWWQASARRALLEKFGYFVNQLDGDKLAFLTDEIECVQRLWKKVVDEILDQRNSRNVNGEGFIQCTRSTKESVDRQAIQSDHHDLIDFVLNQCSKSNHRQLQWSMMSCPRGIQFPLHAHPNLELIYCARGELYEIRMHGEPITRTFERVETSDDSAPNTNVIGPNLTNTKRNWSFGTLKTGQWLVNEIGSVHKSFSSARSDGGCDLLVLWGGSHANILDPPISPNIQNAVDTMEDQLQIYDSCCMISQNHFISQTFLPDSER